VSESSYELLGPDGPFSSAVTGFLARPQQRELSAAIEQALTDYTTLVAEAETGVGKTFAYLVPAMLSGGKVLISTGTKNLQDQLFEKDLPLVRSALGVSTRAALLKGRANYLCVHRLGQARHEHRWRTREAAHDLAEVAKWSLQTESGDIAELSTVPEDSEVWPRVTSTIENCLGMECPDYSDCHVIKARKTAQEADVVIINHHLFCADMSLKEEGFGELLPSANAVILDEAHQLPEVASNFFGQSLSSRQILELARDTIAEQLNDAPDMQSLKDTAGQLDKASRDLRLAMQGCEQKGSMKQLLTKKSVDEALETLADRLEELRGILDVAAERGKGLESCLGRTQMMIKRLSDLRNPDEDNIAWYELYTRSFSLNLTPIDVGSTFERYRERYPCAWVFASATLAVGEDFGHFTARLGLEQFETAQFGSPFDYQNNALLYLPQNMPEPADQRFTQSVTETARALIEANEGRAFLLFTSYRALNQAAEALRDELDYPVLVQGDMPRGELLRRFRDQGNAVLLGTSSFWEGVDVRGDALSLVIIDKLPFASPGDPVMQARLDAIKDRGGNPFKDYQLPQAVLTLKQGAGRLIRDVTDRGMLVICDPRITSKFYGKTFLRSLPEMPVCRDQDQACTFLSNLREQNETACS
jgi:ATP-dependent DNA helicase DinG